ncbi:MAG: hypothetical protein ACI8PF_000651 [Flavobacteriaceae bacterium]|jgi:hypothetical protein
MKFLKYALLASTLIFASCTDENDTPPVVNEEEVITTLTVTLDSGTDQIVLQYQDLDGEGSDPAVITVSGSLSVNTVYNGSIVLLNEIEGENINEEIEEEDLDHQFFYTVGSGLNVTTDYADADSMGNPLGLSFILTTSEASSGALTFTLRHEPNKPNSGLDNAGGETDIEITFNVTVQ